MRQYHNNLEDVEKGFRACWENAQDLVKASEKLIASELHAPALSLSVLALEELAKMMAIDGLLFAVQGDSKGDLFRKATRSHAVKLSILEMFPIFLGNLARADPRYGKEQRYAVAVAFGIEQLRNDGNTVMAALQSDGFHTLDHWKQRGFYTACTAAGFETPSVAVSSDLSRKVWQLAWRATTTLDFVLKGGNVERYIENARSIRSKLSGEQHEHLKALAAQIVNEMFGDRSDSGGSVPTA